MKSALRSRRSVAPRFKSAVSTNVGNQEVRPALWRLLGVLISVLSMNLLVVQPLLRRQERLEQEFFGLKRGIMPLQAAENGADILQQTAIVLDGLRRQHRDVVRARMTIDQLDQFHREFQHSADRFPELRQAIRDLEMIADHARPYDRPAATEPTLSKSPQQDRTDIAVSKSDWMIEIRPQISATDHSPGAVNPTLGPASVYARLSE